MIPVTVTSQVTFSPPCHGMSVMSSGLLVLAVSLERPNGFHGLFALTTADDVVELVMANCSGCAAFAG